MTQHQHIAELLLDLEAVMRNLGLWSERRPDDAALASRMPFCVDTLPFNQWLQFVFIERMHLLIQTEQALPAESNIEPMAEEFFRDQVNYPTSLSNVLKRLDETITG